MFWQGQPFSADGTSAASPAFAGLIALINDARMQQKKSPLGFLNPLIYTMNLLDKSAFNDITSGNNPGCRCFYDTVTASNSSLLLQVEHLGSMRRKDVSHAMHLFNHLID